MIFNIKFCVFLLILFLQTSAVTIRIHQGFIDFEHENVMISDEFHPHDPYTFEINFRDTIYKDYMIGECFLNNYQFLTRFGCLNCNDYVIRSIETDSYNRTGAEKQTLVYFYAPASHLTFTCKIYVINCSGCAERSCERATDISMYQTVMLPLFCSGRDGKFGCDLKAKDNFLAPLIPVSPLPNSGEGIFTPTNSSKFMTPGNQSALSFFWQRYSWLLVLLLVLFLILLIVCCFLCYMRRGVKVEEKKGNQLDRATYEHILAQSKKMEITRDNENNDQQQIIPRVDNTVHIVTNSDAHTSTNNVGTQSDPIPNNRQFDNVVVSEHLEEHSRHQIIPTFPPHNISSSNHGNNTLSSSSEHMKEQRKQYDLENYLRQRQHLTETPVFATHNSQQQFESKEVGLTRVYNPSHENNISAPPPRLGLVRPVEVFDEVVKTKNSNMRSTRNNIDYETSSESIEVQNEREEEIKKAIYAQTFF